MFNVRWFVDGVSVGYGGHADVPANSTVLDGNSQFSWVATAGTHAIEFAVDVDNHVAESNESNNSRSVTVTVIAPPPPPPPPAPPPPPPQCISQLTVQRVWTRDVAGTDKTNFAPGETIQFAAQLNNSYGGHLLAANGTRLTITTSFYNDTKPVDIPPGISTWTWNATAPSPEGSYSVTVKAYDHFCGTLREGSGSFTVGATQSQLPPQIVRVETFREGVLVFFRVFFTDPNNDAEGFGFRWFPGSEEHPFSSPSFGRVSPGKVEYPFNLGCGTGSEIQSGVDVEVWIYDSAGLISPSVTIHLACNQPASPPSPSPNPTCPAVRFFGAHGVNEGTPTGGRKPDKKRLGPEVWKTWETFKSNVPEAVGEAVKYARTTIDWRFLLPTLPSLRPQVSLIKQDTRAGASDLKRRLEHEFAVCGRNTQFVLAGFSQGAWVIDRALRAIKGTNPEVLTQIRGVFLMGDPAWPRTAVAPKRKGIATWFGQGYRDEQTYLDNGVSGRFRSICASANNRWDPICMSRGGLLAQPVSLLRNLNVHLTYVKSGIASEGGCWLATMVGGAC